MRPVVIIKTGGTFPDQVQARGDFEDWTRRGLGLSPQDVQVVQVYQGATLPTPENILAAVITGSHAMVTDREPWMLQTADWLRGAIGRGLPVLGICFGHQLLADALGGRADWNPRGREIGTVEIELTGEGRQDALLGNLPQRFPAHVTHRQSAISLPPGSTLLATSKLDPHQAFRYGLAWGVQFHPEFTAADTRDYIERMRNDLHAEGSDPDVLSDGVAPTPEASSILARFVQLVR